MTKICPIENQDFFNSSGNLPRLKVKQLKETQQVYLIHPGWVKTDMGGPDAPGTVQESADNITYVINLPFKKDAELNARMIGDKIVMDY